MSKSNSQTSISRQTITTWIHSLFSDVPTNIKIDELGKGTVYCRIINHYFPGTVLLSRIISHPKSSYENIINLKIVQNTMAQLRINIPIDPIKLSKEKLGDNWAFITALYRHLAQNHEQHHQVKEDKTNYGFFSQTMAPNSAQGGKRSIDQVYPEHFYQGVARQPFFHIENTVHQKNVVVSGKYSLGKLFKQSHQCQPALASPNKGKWSVNSLMFQNNLMPIIDRIKEILLKSSHDTEKIRQIKMLLNIPLNEEVVVKLQEDENDQITIINPSYPDKGQSTSTIDLK